MIYCRCTTFLVLDSLLIFDFLIASWQLSRVASIKHPKLTMSMHFWIILVAGWKIMNEPNFDFNTTCTTLVTCLFNIKNWLLTTPNTVPITIYLEPSIYTYTGNSSNATFATALGQSSANGAPTRYISLSVGFSWLWKYHSITEDFIFDYMAVWGSCKQC